MVVFFILEAIADERSIVLLDEPDSHIHVARKAELKDYFEKTANRENILTSHSPTLTAKFPEKAIIMLDCQPDGHATVVDKNKQQIVSELTNNIWTLQEQNIWQVAKRKVSTQIWISYICHVVVLVMCQRLLRNSRRSLVRW